MPLFSLLYIIILYLLYVLYTLYSLMLFCRVVGISWFSDYVGAWLQKPCSLCHPHSEYFWKTSSSPSLCQWDTGTTLYHLCNVFLGAPSDSRQGSCNGCRMWFVNLWALGWSRDMQCMGQGFGKSCQKKKKVFASFKPPTGSEQARHVRRGKGRVRTQDLGHQSGACYQLRYRPGGKSCHIKISCIWTRCITMFGACYPLPCMSYAKSFCFLQYSCWTKSRLNMRVWIVPVVPLWMFKVGGFCTIIWGVLPRIEQN